eukprot:scaffold34917_cov166-Amphora_coffeaeformis.AAC.8
MAETPSTPKSKAFSQDTLGSFSAGTGSLGVGDPHVFDSGSTSISTARLIKETQGRSTCRCRCLILPAIAMSRLYFVQINLVVLKKKAFSTLVVAFSGGKYNTPFSRKKVA